MYGFKILCEISIVPFEISHKILNPYPRKICILGDIKNLTTYDILELWHLKSWWDGPLMPQFRLSWGAPGGGCEELSWFKPVLLTVSVYTNSCYEDKTSEDSLIFIIAISISGIRFLYWDRAQNSFVFLRWDLLVSILTEATNSFSIYISDRIQDGILAIQSGQSVGCSNIFFIYCYRGWRGICDFLHWFKLIYSW